MKDTKKFAELNIECIGYKLMYGPKGPGTGAKMWHYKLIHNGHEFLIVDAHMIRLLDMVWTERNEFENAVPDFMSYEFLDNDLVNAVKLTIKKGDVLTKDGEKLFFTQHEIKKPEPVVIPERKDGIYTYNDVNSILNILDHDFDYMFNEDNFKEITQDVADFANQNGYTKLFDNLVGYEFMVTSEGDHKNDGQLVDYFFTFRSPSGEDTDFSTEMCYMVGWNFCGSLEIK